MLLKACNVYKYLFPIGRNIPYNVSSREQQTKIKAILDGITLSWASIQEHLCFLMQINRKIFISFESNLKIEPIRIQ